MPRRSVTARDVYRACRRAAPFARPAPLVHSRRLSEHVDACVYLKLENLQETGSFKVRGAANRLVALSSSERDRGVVTASSGNHGRAIAHVAGMLGVRAVVCVSSRVPRLKVEGIRSLGAQVVTHGDSYDEAEAHSRLLEEELGLTKIYPDDDPLVIAGQGTIGIELLQDLPHIDTAVVPVGGGGLISGVGLALKSADPAIRVVGVSMERSPVMIESLRVGRPVVLEELDTLADGLAGGIGSDNQYTFRMCQEYVDETVLVSEDEIGAAMAFALDEHHLVVEGAGAVGIAALLERRVQSRGAHVVVIVSGGNVDVSRLVAVWQRWRTARFGGDPAVTSARSAT